jgi:hypothetical protein
LCSKLLHNFGVRPCLGKSAHIFEIPDRVAAEIRERALKIGGEAIDNLCAPALSFLIGQNLMSDLPVMPDKLGVGGESRSDLRGANALFNPGKKTGVTLCTSLLHNYRRRAFSPHVSTVSATPLIR